MCETLGFMYLLLLNFQWHRIKRGGKEKLDRQKLGGMNSVTEAPVSSSMGRRVSEKGILDYPWTARSLSTSRMGLDKFSGFCYTLPSWKQQNPLIPQQYVRSYMSLFIASSLGSQ